MAAPATGEKLATCHCGAVTLSLAAWPTEVTECNCSLCRSYGVIWAYCSASEILKLPDPLLTDTYSWNGRNVDFHRCRDCGCVTHWLPRKSGRTRRGINARLLPTCILEAARVRHRDGAGNGEYLD